MAAASSPPIERRLEGRFRESGDQQAHVTQLQIAAKPAGDTIKSLDGRVLGFDLRRDATHDDARAVADFLNQNIAAITLT